MTAEEFSRTIEELGYSQVAISRLFGVNDRTGRRWARGEVPVPTIAERCLQLMRNQGLTPEVMAEIISGRVDEKFGPVEPYYFVWVRPRYEGAEWSVAKYDRAANRYFLPGAAVPLEAREVYRGHRVHLDPPPAV